MANQYSPDSVSPPGESLQDTIEALGMSQVELASRTGRPKKTINEIVRGKAGITPETAIQFERVLGVPSSFWNNRQRHYDEYLAQRSEDQRLREHRAWLKLFPYDQMVKHGWVERTTSAPEKARELLNFFGVASPEVWNTHWQKVTVNFRKSQAFEADRYALAAWLRAGEVLARKMVCKRYDKNRFLGVLEEIRNLTVEPAEVFEPRLATSCASCGVAVVFVRELPKIRTSGATRWLSSTKALIQLSLRYRTDDHLWYSFFHEAAHILLHPKRSIFLEQKGNESVMEDEANRFAADFLIPHNRLSRFLSVNQPPRISLAAISQFAKDLGISPGIVVGRLQHDKEIGPQVGNGLKRRFQWAD